MKAPESVKFIRSVCFLLTFGLTVVCSEAFCADMTSYVRKDTWQQTVLDLREKIAQSAVPSNIEPGPWYTTGALTVNSFSDVLFPEEKVDLDAKSSEGRNLWEKRDGWADGICHSLPSGGPSSTYLFRTVTMDEAKQITVELGSDDGLEFWLNDKKLLSRDVRRVVAPNQDKLMLDLAAGENRLLMKIYNHSGGHGFYFATAEKDLISQMWGKLEQDFPVEAGWSRRDLPGGDYLKLLYKNEGDEVQGRMLRQVFKELGAYKELFQEELKQLEQKGDGSPDQLDIYVRACRLRNGLKEIEKIDVEALRLAVEDLTKTFPEMYKKGDEYLKRLKGITKILAESGRLTQQQIDEILTLKEEALLSNPLLDFDRLILINRRIGDSARAAMGAPIGMAQNWVSNSALPKNGYDNEITVLSPVSPEGELKTLFKPEGRKFVGDVDLDFDAGRMLFSMPAGNDWAIFEIDADGKNLRKMLLIESPAVSNYDGCYLPGGNIMFTSTAPYTAVPCIAGTAPVTNLYRWEVDTNRIRQLAFDQDHDWCPTILNNGRVLYTRWEYSDTPHYFTRLLFHCNPDGTEQMEYYGSNSYFPNSFFYARPIPDHPTKVVGIVSGHHGIARSGRLMIVDPALGRREADGVVQEIPGRGSKVEAKIEDQLVDGVWPQFLHPYPLSEKYFLVSAKLTPDSLWGIYLVDVFDNMTLVKEIEGSALLEPMPFVARKTPPVIPDRVDVTRKDTIFYLENVYAGPGLKDVPKGTVKKLRLFSYHFAYNNVGGHDVLGTETGWDVKRILGTVPVEEDGSAMFRAPANTPISFQPLDEQDRALQLMQSWAVGMPGEIASCVGCHESQTMAPPVKPAIATRKQPTEITPWYGSARPFAFRYEIQPVIDKNCISCHDGSKGDMPDFRATGDGSNYRADKAYLSLHPYVRRPGPESDYHLFRPMEYHASTSELVQMLRKGHHGVELNDEDWQRLYTWIDFNAPYAGNWNPPKYRDQEQKEYRSTLAKLYANLDDNAESEYEKLLEAYKQRQPVEPIKPQKQESVKAEVPQLSNWPLSNNKAAALKIAASSQTERTINLGDGIVMKLTLIPAGEFVMGDIEGDVDELPLSSVRIEKPFWMGVCEVTNAQYNVFDPTHDSRYIDQQWKDHTTPGYPANLPDQPVIRISWQQAMDFCDWLSEKTGEEFLLPTEAQWEWACRAGSDSPMWFGSLDSDFADYANLADVNLKKFAVTGVNPQPISNPGPIHAFIPRIDAVDDGRMIPGSVGNYKPNHWGLYDMHGGVAEWTRSLYRPYPYDDNDGRNNCTSDGDRVVRGGSWRDRPYRARSAFRLNYKPYQKVFNVGFRVIAENKSSDLIAEK